MSEQRVSDERLFRVARKKLASVFDMDDPAAFGDFRISEEAWVAYVYTRPDGERVPGWTMVSKSDIAEFDDGALIEHLEAENAKLRAKIDRVKELDGREIMDNLYFDWNAVFNALSDEPEQRADDAK